MNDFFLESRHILQFATNELSIWLILLKIYTAGLGEEGPEKGRRILGNRLLQLIYIENSVMRRRSHRWWRNARRLWGTVHVIPFNRIHWDG